MKKNTAPFEAIGSDVAGVCVTRSGNQYPGEMFVWNAYGSIEDAFIASQKYDPMTPNKQFEKLRKVKYAPVINSPFAIIMVAKETSK